MGGQPLRLQRRRRHAHPLPALRRHQPDVATAAPSTPPAGEAQRAPRPRAHPTPHFWPERSRPLGRGTRARTRGVPGVAWRRISATASLTRRGTSPVASSISRSRVTVIAAPSSQATIQLAERRPTQDRRADAADLLAGRGSAPRARAGRTQLDHRHAAWWPVSMRRRLQRLVAERLDVEHTRPRRRSSSTKRTIVPTAARLLRRASAPAAASMRATSRFEPAAITSGRRRDHELVEVLEASRRSRRGLSRPAGWRGRPRTVVLDQPSVPPPPPTAHGDDRRSRSAVRTGDRPH